MLRLKLLFHCIRSTWTWPHFDERRGQYRILQNAVVKLDFKTAERHGLWLLRLAYGDQGFLGQKPGFGQSGSLFVNRK